MKKVYLTTSIPYVNAAPHIGYALEAVQADALARFYRALNYDVRFQIGTDENAIKNVESAEKLGIPTRQLVDKNSQAFYNLKEILNLSFDYFVRTTSEKHIKGAQKFWRLCEKDIYKKKYQGLYCIGCEAFYKEGECADNVCPIHQRKLEITTEENYFFALSRYQARLEEIIKGNEVEIYPDYRRAEILNFIAGGLEDFSISRPKQRTKGWGIPVPGDDSQRIYVWFDALLNYITGLDFGEDGELFKKYWLNNDNRFLVIGKDIIKFHAIYWPAMLLSARLPLQKKIYVHGFITVEGQKISKSLGNVIDPYQLVEKFGTDAVRYYLLREIPPFEDGNYSHSRMLEIYNSDLANELGNLISRIATIAQKDKVVAKQIKVNADQIYQGSQISLWENFQFNKILEAIWLKIKDLNKEIDNFAPWKKTPEERKDFLAETLLKLSLIGYSLLPLLPQTAQTIINSTQGKIEKIPPLFPKLKLE